MQHSVFLALEEGLKITRPLASGGAGVQEEATGGARGSDTTLAAEAPERVTNGARSQRARRTCRKVTEKANEAPFGSATILSGRRPAVPEANQSDMVVLTINIKASVASDTTGQHNAQHRCVRYRRGAPYKCARFRNRGPLEPSLFLPIYEEVNTS